MNEREQERQRTSIWARYRETAREALAAGLPVTELHGTLDVVSAEVEDALDLLKVRT